MIPDSQELPGSSSYKPTETESSQTGSRPSISTSALTASHFGNTSSSIGTEANRIRNRFSEPPTPRSAGNYPGDGFETDSSRRQHSAQPVTRGGGCSDLANLEKIKKSTRDSQPPSKSQRVIEETQTPDLSVVEHGTLPKVLSEPESLRHQSRGHQSPESQIAGEDNAEQSSQINIEDSGQALSSPPEVEVSIVDDSLSEVLIGSQPVSDQLSSTSKQSLGPQDTNQSDPDHRFLASAEEVQSQLFLPQTQPEVARDDPFQKNEADSTIAEEAEIETEVPLLQQVNLVADRHISER